MQKELIEKNPILKLSFEFSLLIIDYCEKLKELKRFVIANQLFRSGTSIGANCMEAQNAESKTDFIHRMRIAAEEAEETQYWLLLCDYSNSYPDCKPLLSKPGEIHKVLGSIFASSKRRYPVNFFLSLFL